MRKQKEKTWKDNFKTHHIPILTVSIFYLICLVFNIHNVYTTPSSDQATFSTTASISNSSKISSEEVPFFTFETVKTMLFEVAGAALLWNGGRKIYQTIRSSTFITKHIKKPIENLYKGKKSWVMFSN